MRQLQVSVSVLRRAAEEKEAFVRQELEKCPELKGHFNPIIGMENPWNYRNKVTAIFDRDRKGNPVSGVYEEGTHNVIPVERCLIEDELADRSYRYDPRNAEIF